MTITTALEAADAIQTAYWSRKGQDYFYVSHILGSDWASGLSSSFAGKPARYMEIVVEMAEAKFGPLPYNPYDSNE